VIYFVMSW